MRKGDFERFITSLARGAGQILRRYFLKVRQVERKPKAGIVTEADRFSEAYILKALSRKFPNSSIITEESGEFECNSPLLWIIDPLDGTSNYAHGFPWFCVSIALYLEGQPLCGAVYQPVSNELFFAEVGKGVTLNGKRVRVSQTRRMESALLGTGFFYSKGASLKREMAIFSRMNEAALGIRRPGAAALDLACVACGRFDGFWERGLASWDVAAGNILVLEGGGRITDYLGKPTTVDSREVVASNGHLHHSIVSVIQT